MSLVHWSPTDDRSSPETLVARAFGTGLDDLAVDFLAPLDIAISAVLKGCLSGKSGNAFTGADVSRWTMAKRRQGLLAVAATTNGRFRSITSICPNTDCAAKIDLDVDLAQFRQDWRKEKVAITLDNEDVITLRHPTPGDLARWMNDADEKPDWPEAELASILLIGDKPADPGWQETAQAALTQADQLADLELVADCPDCGATASEPLVLELFLMEELALESMRLMDEIHLLAMAYHWTEPDILSLPVSRRRHYLSRIEEAWAA